MRSWASALGVVLTLVVRADGAGQTMAPDTQNVAPAGASLERIRKALERAEPLDLRPREPDFRVEIAIDRFREDLFTEAVKDPNWVPPFGLTTYEFLEKVTPPEVRNPFSNRELAQVTAASFAFALLQRGVQELVDARRGRRVTQVRLQIERELAELERRQGMHAR